MSANSSVLCSHVSESDWLLMLFCTLIDAIMSLIVCFSCLHKTSFSALSASSLFLIACFSYIIYALIGCFTFPAGRSFSFAFSLPVADSPLIGWFPIRRLFWSSKTSFFLSISFTVNQSLHKSSAFTWVFYCWAMDVWTKNMPSRLSFQVSVLL